LWIHLVSPAAWTPVGWCPARAHNDRLLTSPMRKGTAVNGPNGSRAFRSRCADLSCRCRRAATCPMSRAHELQGQTRWWSRRRPAVPLPDRLAAVRLATRGDGGIALTAGLCDLLLVAVTEVGEALFSVCQDLFDIGACRAALCCCGRQLASSCSCTALTRHANALRSPRNPGPERTRSTGPRPRGRRSRKPSNRHRGRGLGQRGRGGLGISPSDRTHGSARTRCYRRRQVARWPV
jgi:hypothetical protein